MIRRLHALWDAFWFEPAPAATLGVCRLLFFGALLAFYAFEDFTGWADVSRAFWRPVWLFSALNLPVLPGEGLAVAQTVWRTALALSAIGLFTRVSTIVAFALGTYLLGLPHNFGQTYHFDALLVFAMLAMAVAPSGDGWSLDGLLRTWRRREIAPPSASGLYGWPIRFVWVAMSLVFCAAGLSKLRHSGLAWITSDTMAIVLTRAHYHVSDADPIGSLGLAIARSPLVSRILAALTIVIETAFPLALISRRARSVLVPSAALMLLGIRVLMGPTFGVFLVCTLFWVPWERIGLQIRRRAATWSRRTIVCTDGSPDPAVLAIIRRLDVLGRVDLRRAMADAAVLFPARTGPAPHLRVIDAHGRERTGFDAVRSLAAALPAGWLVLPLLMLPGARALGSRVARRAPRDLSATPSTADLRR
jgi:vitamin K-dependent gamma-carboxylase-like protein